MDTIIKTAIKGLNVVKIFKSESTETLLISLEKEHLLATHVSPKKTLLVLLEGNIDFYLEKKLINIVKYQTYTFDRNIEHYVKANEDSKFLIIR
ncbi:MAG: hypothetical protein KDC56_05615 [Flavobacteriaceae bacterium]|nr:hypothetical protein [Flavobacteriaceae bacterium]